MDRDQKRPLRVAVLGSTGSIGVSALQVIARHSDQFRVTVLSANASVDSLRAQAREHDPACVVVTDEAAYATCQGNGPEWVGGRDALLEAVQRPDVDIVLNALVGFAGLEPSLRALEAGKRLALANKESLVTGGGLVLDAMKRGGGELIPVDSEHSALLQCMTGRPGEGVARLILTASGGPFRGWDPARLAGIGPSDALRHPTWEMGARITVASATLANKALEVIEAHFLFQMAYRDIDVVVHPQSIIHSLVEFVDGSVVAQLGFPTMELPILYALSHPERLSDSELRTFDPLRSSPLTFEPVDTEAFPIFGMGRMAGAKGGTAPTVFNAANEIAVGAFLEGRLTFPGMAEVVGETLESVGTFPVRELGDVLEADGLARRVALKWAERAAPALPGSNA
ncbi:MAG: 1-deoxy-D-xylulose-5-phosphate reductoisomerase [Gemmatimonadota bacterium]